MVTTPGTQLEMANAHADAAAGQTTDVTGPGRGLRYFMGMLSGQDIPMVHRGLAVFDPIAQTVEVALFIELTANDALKSSAVNHGLTMLWDRKGAQVGHRAGEKVPGVGAGGVVVGGWLAGTVLGDLAQGMLTGDQPEVIIHKLRSMAAPEGEMVVLEIMDALRRGGCTKAYALSDVCLSDDDALGHNLYLGREWCLAYAPEEAQHIPREVSRLDPSSLRYHEELGRKRATEKLQRAMAIGMLVFFAAAAAAVMWILHAAKP